jgi:hypothetical protein
LIAGRAAPVQDVAPVAGARDQPRGVENLEVLRDRARGDAQPAGNLDRRQRLVEHLEEASALLAQQVDERGGLRMRWERPEGRDAATWISKRRRLTGI